MAESHPSILVAVPRLQLRSPGKLSLKFTNPFSQPAILVGELLFAPGPISDALPPHGAAACGSTVRGRMDHSGRCQ